MCEAEKSDRSDSLDRIWPLLAISLALPWAATGLRFSSRVRGGRCLKSAMELIRIKLATS